MKNKILIFGTGSGMYKVLEIIDLNKVEILAFVDNDINKQGKYINDIFVISPEEIGEYDYNFIVIASIYAKEISVQLYKLGVEDRKLIKIFDQEQTHFRAAVKKIYEDNQILNSILKEEFEEVHFRNYAICNMILPNRNKFLYSFPDYILKGIDYVRVSTLELMAREINNNAVPGSVAELGVYKGDFSIVINSFFPDRKLYLFDTFEGFTEVDVAYDSVNELSNSKIGHLGDSSVELVLQKLGNREQCIVKKGYFPESADGLENELFAFVSIDTDLYLPIYEGLKFFYPKLSKGGYILVHDYNHTTYTGVKKAVQDYCKERGINYTPVSDYFGSAIITK